MAFKFGGDLDFKIDTEVNRLRKNNGRFMKGIPDMEEDVARKFAEDIEDNIKESVRKKFDRFEGDLYDNIEARRSGSTGQGVKYEVSANAYSDDGVNYAAWHEFAKEPHYAYYFEYGEPNRELIKWAKMKGIFENTWRLEVTPMNQQEGSFIEPGVREAISAARKRMRSSRNSVSKDLKESFG